MTPRTKEELPRRNYATSDDDQLLERTELFFAKILEDTGRRKFLMKSFLSLAKIHRQKIDDLPKSVRDDFLDHLNHISNIVGKKDLKKMSFYMFDLGNVKKRIMELIISGVESIHILEYISKACESKSFNRFNKDGWKQMYLLKKNDIDKMRHIIKNMRFEESKGDKEIQAIGFQGLRDRISDNFSVKKRDIHIVNPDVKITRNKKGKITEVK